MTNADKIRSMSDEELAILLSETYGDFPPVPKAVPMCKITSTWLYWLKQDWIKQEITSEGDEK